MKLKCFPIVFLLLLGHLSKGQAQAFADCIGALPVCDYSPLVIQPDSIVGEEEEIFSNDCFGIFQHLPDGFFETSTVWLKYKFADAGRFIFRITPTDNLSDIDFVAFKTNTGDCKQLEPVRCMFSGENVGSESPDVVCLGATGLSNTQTDTYETPGCSDGDDNFLAPIEVEADEVIYLAIKSYSEVLDYTVQYKGTAPLACNEVGIEAITEAHFILYPNPFQQELIIENKQARSATQQMAFCDFTGQVLFSKTLEEKERLDLSSYPSGIYFIKIQEGTRIYLQKVIKAD